MALYGSPCAVECQISHRTICGRETIRCSSRLQSAAIGACGCLRGAMKCVPRGLGYLLDTMKDFHTILLIATLRATVQHVCESPDLDQAHPGIVEFRRVIEAEIDRLQESRALGRCA